MRKHLLILVSTIILTSCNFLDTNIYGVISPENYYSSSTELNTALAGVYSTLADGALYGNTMLGRMALEGEEGYEAYSTDAQTVAYYVVTAQDTKILAYWQSLYTGINRANLLLENIDKPIMDSTERASIKGQALFLRAYFYFMLVNKFGGVPLILESPKSTESSVIQVPKSSVNEVYNKIIEDMEASADLVYDVSHYTGGGHVSKSTVWGVLSRVCLYMAGRPLNNISKYEDAAKWAKKVIDSHMHQLNSSYKQVFVNYAADKYDITESIWEVEFYGNNESNFNSVAGMVGRNNGIGNSSLVDNIGYSPGLVRATGVLTELYNAGDTRKDWAIAPFYMKPNAQNPLKTDSIYYSSNGNKFERHCGKYRRAYEIVTPRDPTFTPENFPLLRYSDVLLMYAEAVNQKSNKTLTEVEDAYEAINQVRRRAYGLNIYNENSLIDISDTTTPIGPELLKFIQDERARELCFEALRRDDLIRWGVFYDKMKSVLPKIPTGLSYYYPKAALAIYTNVSQRDTIWPIPSYELGVNKKLIQNSGF